VEPSHQKPFLRVSLSRLRSLTSSAKRKLLPCWHSNNLLPSNFQDPGPGQALPNPAQANYVVPTQASAAYFGNQNNYQDQYQPRGRKQFDY
jgi:hypothetical protein